MDFIGDLEKFVASLEESAQINSLAQTLIKLTAPGVPDIYQGNEIWDFSLVDPDNRRPVNFELRRCLLAETKQHSAGEAWQRRASGLPKLWLIKKTFAFRAQHAGIFEGSYEPVIARGENADGVIAFVRDGQAMTVVPRFTRSRHGEMPTLPLPKGKWSNEFTGESFSGEIEIGELFKKFPVALLVRK
jgi:(1->4)-alpha-D-glucan 1-alpha-D-glucosylmutase